MEILNIVLFIQGFFSQIGYNVSISGRFNAAYTLLATVYLLTQTALATIGAFFYNLVSDLVGGIEVVVLEESYNDTQEKISENTRDENQDNKETMMMTFSKTLKNFKNEEDENE